MTLRPRGREDWLHTDPGDLAPTVLLLGGFLTAPPLYWPLRRRLLARGVAAVVIGNVWTPDWLLAGLRGLGPTATRAGRALLAANAAADANEWSRGSPVLVVGHSAGGTLARLLTSPEPFAGRRFAAARRIGAIVSLGTPHHIDEAGPLGSRLGAVGAGFADRVVPGARFAPCVGYVSVASRAIVGRRAGTGRERLAYRLYEAFMPEPNGPEIAGDGLVPVGSALLGAGRQLVLDGALHGVADGREWYGGPRMIDTWWPLALTTWREAIAARQAEARAGQARHAEVRDAGQRAWDARDADARGADAREADARDAGSFDDAARPA